MHQPLAPSYTFPPLIQEWLEEAGWYAGRSVSVQQPDMGEYPPAVLALLQEFNGLRVGPSNRCIDFNPLAAEGDYVKGGDFMDLAQDLGCKLYCLGETAEYERVLLNVHGGVFTVGSNILLRGMSFVEGISNLLLDQMEGTHCFNYDDQTWDSDHHRIIWPAATS